MKDVCDFFNKCPLLKGSTMRIYLNTNQTYFTLNAYGHAISAAGVIIPGNLSLASAPIILGGGQTCPIMIASGDLGQGSMAALLDAAGINNQDSPSPPRKTKEQAVRTKREETSSGHSSGLQSGRQFGQKEKELKIKRDAENAKLATEGQNETIYRDKRGRKLDALTEFMRQSAVEEGILFF
jgi:hypothetical protein